MIKAPVHAPTDQPLVVFERGYWVATPIGRHEPVPTDAPTTGHAGPPGGPRDRPAGAADLHVVPAGPVLLRHRDGRLIAWNRAEEREVVLGQAAVELLSRPGSSTIGQLRGTRPDEAAWIPVLLQCGLLELSDEPWSRPPPPWTPAEEPATLSTPAPTGTSRPRGGALRALRDRIPLLARPERRTRVLASWDIDRWGQPLALGGLLAYARVHRDGRLATTYDIRPVMTHRELLQELVDDASPSVVLLSDYMWSTEANLEVTELIRSLDGDHLVVHGGPDVPTYAQDEAEFFTRNPGVGVVVHGEGEITLAELLVALDGDPLAVDRLADVQGLTVRRAGGRSRTPDRPRFDDLSQFPSPYLSGEFDHLDPTDWKWPSIETNRGCPYSCTFCDWGSATRSRVRDFPMERVVGELRWLAEHGLRHWMIDDANFGIHKRDVEIARLVVELRRQYGIPDALYVNYAKNTTKYLTTIIGMLTQAGITGEGALALQTRDPGTLRAIQRSNIRVDKYDELAEEFRRHGLPLVTDLIIGLPGQTVATLLTDMQYCIDADITPRFFVALVLPNAEMNNPEYRERFQLVLGDGNVVVASDSFSEEERSRMMRLRMAYRCFEHYGQLRHVLRYLQWDLGVPAAEALDRIERQVHARPDRFPLMNWVLNYLDVFLVPPFGWPPFLEEVGRLVVEEFGVEDDDRLRTVLEVQAAVLPEPGREFPLRVPLRHDYVAWYLAHTGATDEEPVPLGDLGAGTLVVAGDPIHRCTDAIGRITEQRPHDLEAAPFWTSWHWELDSPLQRLVPETATNAAEAQVDYVAG